MCVTACLQLYSLCLRGRQQTESLTDPVLQPLGNSAYGNRAVLWMCRVEITREVKLLQAQRFNNITL